MLTQRVEQGFHLQWRELVPNRRHLLGETDEELEIKLERLHGDIQFRNMEKVERD